ncbi:MAG TPA: GNAT family N-acetyltransferase [Aggregatilineales bacterium]|nr:GNAT family N-acetyltransferase [Anaerolineales bacterium]HRE47092.1 GNAT family N-acetyltransferase [Aggregatilineales bacterium]
MAENDFPKTVTLNGTAFTLRLMTAKDRHSVVNFVSHLPENDTLFMRRDVTQPEAVDEWIHDIEKDRTITILVEERGNIAAYGSLHYNQLFWNRHLAELRVLVSSMYRRRGLASALAKELIVFARTLGLDKVVAYVASEDRRAREVMEQIGFRAEAVLQEWVKTRDERTHDLLIMSVTL